MHRRLGLLWLLAGAAALALPAPASALGLGLFLCLFLATRPPRREAAVVSAAFGLSSLALLGAWALTLRPPLSLAQWTSAGQESYRKLWSDLRAEAARAARTVPLPAAGTTGRLQAFRALASEVGEAGFPGTLVLLNPDGEAVAWSGEGLLHEPAAASWSPSGIGFVASFTSVTCFASAPAGPAAGRPWRMVAGRSFSTARLPFPAPGRETGTDYRWSLLPAGATPAGERVRVVRLADPPQAPAMVIEAAAVPTGPADPSAGVRRTAWTLLGVTLLALAVMRAVGLALLSRTVLQGRARGWEIGLLATAGGTCAGAAAGVPCEALAVLAAGLAVGAGGFVVVRGGRSRRLSLVCGGATWTALALGARWFQEGRPPMDLGAGFAAIPETWALRLAFFTAALGCLVWSAGREISEEGPARDFPAWFALCALAGAAALHDRPLWALPLLALSGAAAATWTDRRGLTRRSGTIAAAVLLAAMASAVIWESGYRDRLRAEASALLPNLGPPTAEETAALERETQSFFARLDLASLTPRGAAGLDREDLAFAVWRVSPLARRNALSALAIQPFDGAPASFSFGLPLGAESTIDRDALRWHPPRPPAWEQTEVHGEVTVYAAAKPFGRARYWLWPRPGFRLGGEEAGDLAVGLLRGGPAVREIEGLPAQIQYGLYREDGRPLHTPWKDAPSLDRSLRGGAAQIATPAGEAWALLRSAADGVEVLYVPRLELWTALDRVGTDALAVLLFSAGALGLVLLFGLQRHAFRAALRRAVRSYSKRLLIVYTFLLLLPLLLLSLALVRGLERRVRAEQRADGEAALSSAQRVLSEYLSALAPGFSLNTALDDALLGWLSGVVHHEVNLYWGSNVWASSKRELFTSALLPKRIPGDIYAQIALEQREVAARTSQTGGTAYLEIYGPLRVPGAPAEENGFALSMPLLAQQEEMSAAVATLRRQAFLVTAALFLLLVAVGIRLADNFTKPLQELVAGTQRIAAGAPSLGLAPEEAELAALVEAVDRMAARIAETRERLLREKQVVERVVENITAGVVSIDRGRRVMMHNRAATQWLGVAAGQNLDQALGADPRLAPVAAFVASARGQLLQTTVRMPGGNGDQEWTLVWAPLPGEGEPAALLVVEDSTEVLRAQRLEAWAEMARMIAHEIKNPLTPIRLSAEHMREVYAADPDRFAPVFERCTENILRQVEDLRQIASEFSTYSQIPKLHPLAGDLVGEMRRVVDAYLAAPPPGIELQIAAEPARIETRFDAKLLGRALRNLIENAVRACGGRGVVAVRIERQGDEACIRVTDSGPGVAPELLARIFDPYFSTHAAGTGLGLPIARRIAEQHGGTIEAHNCRLGGLEVVLSIPIA